MFPDEFVDQSGQGCWRSRCAAKRRRVFVLHINSPLSLRVLCGLLAGESVKRDLLAILPGRAGRVEAIGPGDLAGRLRLVPAYGHDWMVLRSARMCVPMHRTRSG